MIKISILHIHTDKEATVSGKWLDEHRLQVIQLDPIFDPNTHLLVYLVLWDDTEPVPEPLLTRRIRDRKEKEG